MISRQMLNTIFNIWDPMDVMYHAPSDEYRQLTDEVFERLHSSMTKEDIFNVLYERGETHYDIFPRMYEKICGSISELIYQINHMDE
ncbi:MAG: hypothetical protein FWC32_00610 [Firmicutes bacterium]|nr:hypothetical protein [Bacillota bacterium]